MAAAKALLKQAGVKLPVTVQLTVPNNPDMRQVGEVIQSMAAEAGFDVQINAIGVSPRRWTRPTAANSRPF